MTGETTMYVNSCEQLSVTDGERGFYLQNNLKAMGLEVYIMIIVVYGPPLQVTV